MSILWLETFLDRLSKPTYYRSNPGFLIQEEFARAALDDTLLLVNKKISYLEHKRKEIVFIEIIESTVRRKPICSRLRLPRNCRFPQAGMSAAALAAPQYTNRTQVVRASDPYPISMIDNGRNNARDNSMNRSKIPKALAPLDSKTMMLENEGKIQWYKKLRNSVRSAIRTRNRLFSAIYCVPPEIWSQIFLFCLPSADCGGSITYGNNDDFLEPAQSVAPLLLCGVCHTWRSAATQTPPLWNSLTIHLRGQTSRLPFLQTWINRSGELPLDLNILWGPTQSLQFHDTVFDFLLTLAPRWRRLRLSVVHGLVWQAHGFPTRAQGLLAHAMPALQTLELEPYPSLNVASLQRNAPGLRALRLANASLNPMHLMAGVPWTYLTAFRSPYPLDMAQALKVFKMCPALVECELAVVSCPAGDIPRATPLGMRCLRRLELNETLPHVVDAFFRLLELPRLEEMRICAEGENWSFENREPWTVRELLLLVHRSVENSGLGGRDPFNGRGLKRLKIQGLNCDESNVKSLVFGIPSLVSLDVKNRGLELKGDSWVQHLRTTKRERK